MPGIILKEKGLIAHLRSLSAFKIISGSTAQCGPLTTNRALPRLIIDCAS